MSAEVIVKGIEQKENDPYSTFPKIDVEFTHMAFVSSEMSGFKRALFCICGVTKSQLDDEENAANMVSTVSPAQQAMEAADSLKEHPLWGNVCTVNAVILMLICAFIWGFYA